MAQRLWRVCAALSAPTIYDAPFARSAEAHGVAPVLIAPPNADDAKLRATAEKLFATGKPLVEAKDAPFHAALKKQSDPQRGATLFATSKGENRLVAVDLASGETRAVALGPAPYHLTAVRGAGTLYVSSRAEPRVWVVNQRTLAIRGEFVIGGIGHQMALEAR